MVLCVMQLRLQPNPATTESLFQGMTSSVPTLAGMSPTQPRPIGFRMPQKPPQKASVTEAVSRYLSWPGPGLRLGYVLQSPTFNDSGLAVLREPARHKHRLDGSEDNTLWLLESGPPAVRPKTRLPQCPQYPSTPSTLGTIYVPWYRTLVPYT